MGCGGAIRRICGSCAVPPASADIARLIPGAMATPRKVASAPTAVNVVAVPKSTTIHAPCEAVVGGDGVGDKVRTDLGGVVHREGQARIHRRTDDERLHARLRFEHPFDAVRDRWDNAADHDVIQRVQRHVGLAEEVAEEHAVLVRHLVAHRAHAPVPQPRRAIVQAKDDVGISHVDG